MVVSVSVGVIGCGGDDDGGGDDIEAARITRCDEIHEHELGNANIDDLVAQFEGTPCTGPLAGGIAGLAQECQFGAPVSQCGQSSGLSQFGCTCGFGNVLTCSNGEAIAANAPCNGDAGVDGI